MTAAPQRRALIVDDSRAIRMILTEILHGLGYQVSEAPNGKSAAETLENCANSDLPEIVLVDWNMPEMNGLDFVKYVRAHSKYSNVQLMMVTTETQIEQMAAALEAGANEYVMKPFTEVMIAEKLRLIGSLA